jgi:hypothetical protein
MTAGDHRLVAGTLALVAQLASDEPHQRMEPEQACDEVMDVRLEIVVPRDVFAFVREHRVELRCDNLPSSAAGSNTTGRNTRATDGSMSASVTYVSGDVPGAGHAALEISTAARQPRNQRSASHVLREATRQQDRQQARRREGRSTVQACGRRDHGSRGVECGQEQGWLDSTGRRARPRRRWSAAPKTARGT